MTPRERLQEAKDQAACEFQGKSWNEMMMYFMIEDKYSAVWRRAAELMYEGGKKDEAYRLKVEDDNRKSAHLTSNYSAHDAELDAQDENAKWWEEQAKEAAKLCNANAAQADTYRKALEEIAKLVPRETYGGVRSQLLVATTKAKEALTKP